MSGQVKALLKRIEAYRRETCLRLRQEAEAEACRLIEEAYREGRRRLHRAVVEERARARRELQATQARFDTARRRHHQRRLVLLLEEGRKHLRQHLLEAWKEDESRRRWVGRLGERAARIFPEETFQVFHPVAWPEEEQRELARRLGREVAFFPDEGIEAGLRVCIPGACLDGTLEGLDWEALSMRLLFFLEGG